MILEVVKKKKKDKYKEEKKLEKQEHIIICILGKYSHPAGSQKKEDYKDVTPSPHQE